jgi:hypothetical protein
VLVFQRTVCPAAAVVVSAFPSADRTSTTSCCAALVTFRVAVKPCPCADTKPVTGVVWSTPVRPSAPLTTFVSPSETVAVMVAFPTGGAIRYQISTWFLFPPPLLEPTRVSDAVPYVMPVIVLAPSALDVPTIKSRSDPGLIL